MGNTVENPVFPHELGPRPHPKPRQVRRSELAESALEDQLGLARKTWQEPAIRLLQPDGQSPARPGREIDWRRTRRPGPDQNGRRDGARPAGQRLPFHTSFVGPDSPAVAGLADEIDVGALRPDRWI